MYFNYIYGSPLFVCTQVCFWTILFSFGNVFIRYQLRLNSYSTRSFFLVHSFANAVIVILVYKDTIFTILNPLQSCSCRSTGCESPALFVMFGIHLSHIIVDYKILNLLDWCHHIFSCLMCGYFVLSHHVGPIVNFAMMFACGFPGMIDYFLLFLVKTKKVSKIFEKKVNTKLNLWIRMPFLVMFGTIIWTCWISGFSQKTLDGQQEMSFETLMCFIVFISLNGIFFAERVAVSYGRTNPYSSLKKELRKNTSHANFCNN